MNDRAPTSVAAAAERGHALSVANEPPGDPDDQIGRFQVALDNLVQGVCFFDSAHRLILANRRYAEIYNLSLDTIRPGTTLEEIVDRRFEAGTFPDMTPEEYLAWRTSIAISAQNNDTVVELKSGQVVSIHHRPLPDGGWVSTHEDITERRQTEKRLAHMARHDVLTGLPNRVALGDYLIREASRRVRDVGLAVFCLDLDRFKYINDTFGHAVGDALLRAVAERLRANVRAEDMVVRLGGDEFAIMQITVDQPSQATALASRLVEVIAQPFDLDGRRVTVGTSVGIAYSLARDADPETLLKNADMALYRAKSYGRGTFCFFDPAMQAQARTRHLMEAGLRTALDKQEFELFFQPIVNAHTETLVRFEALLRWRHPSLGPIEPARFIPMAEEIGLIIPLGEWVLKKACTTAAGWADDTAVAVNISALQLKNNAFVDTVRGALQTSGLCASRLELEVTETVLLQDSVASRQTLEQLRQMGVRIALDDFGIGYSSIGCLRTFRFDRIKIDQSFIRDVAAGSDSIAIIHAIVDLGVALGMAVTVEGIETQEQLRIVRAESCAEAQGYLFSPPVTADDVPLLITRMRRPQEGASTAHARSLARTAR